jgi:hypothetical protein
VGDDLLRAQREGGRFGVGSASASSSELVCSELRAAQHRRERLQRGADHVVVGLLRGERHPGRLRVEAQLPRALILRAERSRITRAQILRAARNLAISSKKSLCAVEEERDDAARSRRHPAASHAHCTYSMPSRSVNASSCNDVEPASRMW